MRQPIEDTQLSPDFWLSEFTRSTTATKEGLCTGEVLCIEPTEEQVERLRALCVGLLQPLRDRFGRLDITSGLRSSALNEVLDGSATSAHLTGDGVDVSPARAKPVDIMVYLEKHERTLKWDQAILYKGHVHLGWMHPTTRKQRRELRIARLGKFPLWSLR